PLPNPSNQWFVLLVPRLAPPLNSQSLRPQPPPLPTWSRATSAMVHIFARPVLFPSATAKKVFVLATDAFAAWSSVSLDIAVIALASAAIQVHCTSSSAHAIGLSTQLHRHPTTIVH